MTLSNVCGILRDMVNTVMNGLGWFAGIFTPLVLMIVGFAVLGIVIFNLPKFMIVNMARKHPIMGNCKTSKIYRHINLILGWTYAALSLFVSLYMGGLYWSVLALPIVVLVVIHLINWIMSIFCQDECVRICEPRLPKPSKPKPVPAKAEKPTKVIKEPKITAPSQGPIAIDNWEEPAPKPAKPQKAQPEQAAPTVVTTTTSTKHVVNGETVSETSSRTTELRSQKAELKEKYTKLEKHLEKIQEKNMERHGVGFHNDTQQFQRTGSVQQSLTVKTVGKYDETEVQNALRGLKVAMDELQVQIDEREAKGITILNSGSASE